MKATITGRDSLSTRIMLDLDAGLKVSQIPEHYPVSLDQVKKLSRFNTMLTLAKDHLNKDLYNRLQQLGIKSLPLSHLFRQHDWEGIVEILSVVTDETTRDALHLLINALNEKRKRILEFKEKADLSLSQLETEEQSLQVKEKELLILQKELEEQLEVFKQYPEPFCSFLGEHLGLYEGKLMLAKKINVNWQKNLKKQGIIEYDQSQYFFLKDLGSFIDSLKFRYNHGLAYRWNREMDIKNKIPTVFNDSFINSMNKIKQELKEIEERKVFIQDELIKIKHETVQSYMGLAKASNYLSTTDLKKQKELQVKALKWLFHRGFIAVAEFTLPNGKRADIFAYNESQIVIFNIKVSKSDLMTVQKWPEYLPYCHDFFFLTPIELIDTVNAKTESINCGQFIETSNSIRLVKPDANVRQVKDVDGLRFSASQLLSKKFIYGY